MKTPTTYWNPLDPRNLEKWEDIDGADGRLKQLTLAIDEETGDYTRLTWFQDGFYTGAFGAKSHPYPEEILSLPGGCTTKHLMCGWSQDITRPGHREKFMGHSGQGAMS